MTSWPSFPSSEAADSERAGQQRPATQQQDHRPWNGSLDIIPDKCEELKIVRDISLLGLYLFGEVEAELYDRCYLKLTGLKDNQIELALRIVRLEREGVGMEYLMSLSAPVNFYRP